MTKEEFKRRFTEITGLGVSNIAYRCKKHHIEWPKDTFTAKELDRITYKKSQQYGGVITDKINRIVDEAGIAKNQVYYRMRVTGIIRTDLITMEYDEFKRRIVDEWVQKGTTVAGRKLQAHTAEFIEKRTNRFENRGLFDYVWWEDLLPLQEALQRGIYNEDGVLNVFKDPSRVMMQSLTCHQYIDFMRSRGYSVVYDYNPRTEYPANFTDGLYRVNAGPPTSTDVLDFKRID